MTTGGVPVPSECKLSGWSCTFTVAIRKVDQKEKLEFWDRDNVSELVGNFSL
jgi:hypothetical protein